MYASRCPEDGTGVLGGEGARLLPDGLRRVTGNGGTIHEAFQILACYQEEQARAAADLLERETWAVTRILIASAPIWNQDPSPTLRFSLDHLGESVPYRLELSRFSRLADLPSPSPGERVLIEATTPCWAKVTPHLERHLAGYTDALACSYVPISVAEAVRLLGLARIMAQIEAATQAASQAVLNEARIQEDRRARLLAVERMFGWETDTPGEQRLELRDELALALFGKGNLGSLTPVAICLGLSVGVLCFLAGFAQALLVFLLGVVLLVGWGLYLLRTSKGG